MMSQASLRLIGINCFVYIDDIFIFDETINERNKNLKIVLQQIQKLGLKLGTIPKTRVRIFRTPDYGRRNKNLTQSK